jgi:hypothetical protein
MDRLRNALSLRAEKWKADLRWEPQIARLVLRRLIGPICYGKNPGPSSSDGKPLRKLTCWRGLLPPFIWRPQR